MRFTIERQDEPYHEAELIERSGRDYCYDKYPQVACVPVGSVAWCERVYGARTPDYYPDFARAHLGRAVWRENYDPQRCYAGVFVKPAACHKAFDGTTDLPSAPTPPEPGDALWCSDVVSFGHEWRYYVADGRVCAAAWYDGPISDDDYLAGLAPPPPPLPPDLSDALTKRQWCGALDMGMLRQRGGAERLVLVEASHPYGVGWYPDSGQGYVEFLLAGDAYLRRVKS